MSDATLDTALPRVVEPARTALDATPGERLVAVPTTGLLDADAFQLWLKRTIDVVGSLILLVALSPILVLVALAVATTSRGGVFFVQERLGKDARPFPMLKFRSMYRDADARLAEVGSLNECDGPVFKVRADPRMTPLGRILRRSSLDELPQLLNVLWGHMSLVGPRPPLQSEYVHYSPRDRCRLLAKPGLTCTWQVSGRSDLDFATWVDMDLDYIFNWSLWLDLQLLLRTVPAVLSGRGAY